MKQKYVLYLLFIFIYFLHQTVLEVNQGGRASQVKKEAFQRRRVTKEFLVCFSSFFGESKELVVGEGRHTEY